jgi:hypothetical protein
VLIQHFPPMELRRKEKQKMCLREKPESLATDILF